MIVYLSLRERTNDRLREGSLGETLLQRGVNVRRLMSSERSNDWSERSPATRAKIILLESVFGLALRNVLVKDTSQAGWPT
jgi:hypothetical protein